MADSFYFDELISQANQTAREGDWNGTLQFLLKADELLHDQVEILSAIGGTLVQLNRVEDALPYYQRVQFLSPESPQGILNLANALSLLERWAEAEQLYRDGIKFAEEDHQLWIGLARACLNQDKVQEGVEILAAMVASGENDIEAILMLAECYEEGSQFESANFLFQKVLKLDPKNELAQQGLKRVEEKRKNNQTQKLQDLAQKLKALKDKTAALEQFEPKKSSTEKRSFPEKRITFYGPAQTSVEVRFGPVIQRLIQKGIPVQVATHIEPNLPLQPQVAFFSKPHISEEFTQAVERFAQNGVKVVVDLEEDFRHIPEQYYGYQEVGAGNPAALQRLERVLQAANIVTVPSKQLAEVYQPDHAGVVVIPYAWDENNSMWTKSNNKRSNPQIGILANHTQAADIEQINLVLGKVLEEFPSVLVGIVGNLKVYEALFRVSDERKYFIPPTKIEDYPFLLADFDVLLFPLAGFSYNQTRPDLALLEAGARGVAWLAAPIPSYLEWGEGGVFANSTAEWEAGLNLLLKSAITNAKLGEAGRQKAQSRRSKELLALWLDVME